MFAVEMDQDVQRVTSASGFFSYLKERGIIEDQKRLEKHHKLSKPGKWDLGKQHRGDYELDLKSSPIDDQENMPSPEDDQENMPSPDDDPDYIPSSDSDPDYIPSIDDDPDNIQHLIDDQDPMLPSTYRSGGFSSDSEGHNQEHNKRRDRFGCEFVAETDDETSQASTTFPLLQCAESHESSVGKSSATTSDSQVKVLDSSESKFCICLFCNQKQKKLPRHLRTMHAEEDDVRVYLQSKDKQQKKKMLYRIRNLGNHKHNWDVLKKGQGVLIVVHCPSSAANADPSDFVPCPYCFGYFRETLLHKHACLLSPAGKVKGSQKLRKGRLLLPTSFTEAETQEFLVFLQSFRSDDVSVAAKKDRTIMQLMRSEFDRLGYDVDQHNYVRTKGRETARLLVELRKVTGRMSAKLSDFISPDMVEAVMTATHNICGFQPATQQYSNPSLALKLGHNIKKCAMLVKASAIECSDTKVETDADRFLYLLEMRWNAKISHHAHRTLYTEKRNAPCLLPLTEDIVKLSDHLQEKSATSVNALQSDSSCNCSTREAWSELNEVTLVQCIIFNRRRQGEVSKMKLADFKSALTPDRTVDASVMAGLSPLEQQLCKSLTRIEIAGKRGKTVPVLLTNNMWKALELLVERRSNIRICEDNRFLFPKMYYGAVSHIRGSDCLRDHAAESGAQHPELLRSTKLRKQIATMAQVINLKGHEEDILANFLGHDIRIHRNYYRLPERTLQAAKIAKLLFCIEKGTIASYAGKTLDDITVTAEDVLEGKEEVVPVPANGPEGSGGAAGHSPCVANPNLCVASPIPCVASPNPCVANLNPCVANPNPCVASPNPCVASLNPCVASPNPCAASSDPSYDCREKEAMKRSRETSPNPCVSSSGSCDNKILKKRIIGKRRHWTPEERNAVTRHFAFEISAGKVPGKQAIEKILQIENCLSSRSWKNIKDFIRNMCKND